jgi:hypothetical protein
MVQSKVSFEAGNRPHTTDVCVSENGQTWYGMDVDKIPKVLWSAFGDGAKEHFARDEDQRVWFSVTSGAVDREAA